MRDPLPIICGLMCIYPLLFWAIPAYFIGRNRLHFRSPVVMDRDSKIDPDFKRQALRAAAQKKAAPPPSSDTGYGA